MVLSHRKLTVAQIDKKYSITLAMVNRYLNTQCITAMAPGCIMGVQSMEAPPHSLQT